MATTTAMAGGSSSSAVSPSIEASTPIPPTINLSSSSIDAFKKMEEALSCPLCESICEDPVTTECQHSFCGTCLSKHLQQNKGCPTCLNLQLRTQIKANATLLGIIQSVKRIRSCLEKCEILLPENSLAEQGVSQIESMGSSPKQMIASTEPAGDDPEDDVDNEKNADAAENPPTTGHEQFEEPSHPFANFDHETFSVIPETMAVTASLPPDTQQIEEARSVTEQAQQRFAELSSRIAQANERVSEKAQAAPTMPELPSVEPESVKVFVASSLSGSVRYKQLKTLISRFGQSLLAEDFACEFPVKGSTPTHFLVGASVDESALWRCKPTPKYYWALSAGCFIIREQWLDECQKAGKWISEDDYQVYAYSSSFHPSRSPMPPRLFEGMTFLLGPFGKSPLVFTKPQSKALLELNGARVIDAGGNENGSGIQVTLACFSALQHMPNKVIIVGHPQELTHEGTSCSFCKRVYSAFKERRLRIIESAWVMLCLETLTLRDLSEYELISLE